MPGAGPEVSRPPRTAQRSSGLRRGREGVLAAATALFRTRGYDATSMGDIAEHAGVTKGALYRHVSSKAELLCAVTSPMRAAVFALLGSSAQARGRGVDSLAGLLRGLADVAADDPAGHALLWAARGTAAGDDRDSACREAVFWRLVDLLEQAIAEGDVRDDIAPRLSARLLLGAVAGTNCLPGEPVAPSNSAVDVLLGGLRPTSVA
ncbi:TetR family transcriptional regulator [Streptomyces sp. NPDC048581]|uniref:TetR family transcriptional regulator n=1 Tax=unclassified Streptomyces TaxID=2593676 RepID=UPI0037102F9C